MPIDESQGMTSVNPGDGFARMPVYRETLSIESQRLDRGSRSKRAPLQQHSMLVVVESAIIRSLSFTILS